MCAPLMLTDYVCCWEKKKKSLKNDFENFPPENVTTVLCIDLEMSVKAMNSDYDEKLKKKKESLH